MQTRPPLGTGLLDRRFDVEQQRDHLVSPVLLLLFGQEGQFPQMVDIAQRVVTRILPVGLPPIMHAHAMEVREDADLVQRLFAAFSAAPH